MATEEKEGAISPVASVQSTDGFRAESAAVTLVGHVTCMRFFRVSENILLVRSFT